MISLNIIQQRMRGSARTCRVGMLAIVISITASGPAVLQAQEASFEPVSREAFDLPVTVDVRKDGVSVYRKEVVSEIYTIDQIFKSMQGPQAMHFFDLGIDGPPELLWLTRYESQIVAPDGSSLMSKEFMCHNHLLINTDSYHERFPTKIRTKGDRIFDLAQGQSIVSLPDGFGIPWMSDEKLNFNSQVLNHNVVGDAFEVRIRASVEYVRDSELPSPLKPLVQRGVFGMKLIEGPDGHFGRRAETPEPSEEHGPGCLIGEDAGSPTMFKDGVGRTFTGFWVVEPGREENHTRVTPQLDVPYDTTVHYISVHLHPFGESLALRDLTTGETLFESKTRQADKGVGLAMVEDFSSEEGIPIYKDHEYELVSVYNNTTGVEQDAMSTMFLYLRATDLYDFDFRPRKKLPPVSSR